MRLPSIFLPGSLVSNPLGYSGECRFQGKVAFPSRSSASRAYVLPGNQAHTPYVIGSVEFSPGGLVQCLDMFVRERNPLLLPFDAIVLRTLRSMLSHGASSRFDDSVMRASRQRRVLEKSSSIFFAVKAARIYWAMVPSGSEYNLRQRTSPIGLHSTFRVTLVNSFNRFVIFMGASQLMVLVAVVTPAVTNILVWEKPSNRIEAAICLPVLSGTTWLHECPPQ